MSRIIQRDSWTGMTVQVTFFPCTLCKEFVIYI